MKNQTHSPKTNQISTDACQKLSAEHWKTQTIAPGAYFNPNTLTGFKMAQGPLGNPLHPNTEPTFEADLSELFESTQQSQPEIELKRVHFQMPAINPESLPGPQDYTQVEEPKPLSTTSVTLAWVKQEQLKQTSIGYHFEGNQLANLRDRLAESKAFRGLVGNLGYFMTKELNVGDHIWSHSRRYPASEHQLPERLAYLGFYYFGDAKGQVENAGFQSAHSAGIGVKHSGEVKILPVIQCHAYDLTIAGQTMKVENINPELDKVDQHDIALFNVNFPLSHKGPLVEFSPMLPLEDRVNVFVSNQGDGKRPHEHVVKVWRGECPLPSFGVVLSIKSCLFDSLYPHGLETNTPVSVTPYSHHCDFAEYAQILAGLVPSVIGGESIVPTGAAFTAQQAEQALDEVANTDAPLSRTGKETNNFDAIIREPGGLFIETENHVGYLLFDGRHEMSVGVNIVDVANLVSRLSQSDIDLFDGETIRNAISIDGGSAMKAYAVNVGNGTVSMDILNRVAAGSRNAPGNDTQGLNLYSTVVMEL
ncbi:hypothetical protein [Vibrio coralliilyticus]|uniref:Uncharacterized protein n=1 Tax=Vibrio coralliilyticus TaxID=190893 RepID=A0AAP7DBZ0_9VIBR|nr:hypothetical protein [Vibrio coralliilyticus]NOJ21517.1 hypothetical protein [Vibrio coralliilyticus]